MIDNIKDGLVSAGKYVSENASIATSKANTKLNLKTKEDVLEKEYAKLGREYFNTLTKKDKNKHKEILDLESEIEKLKKEIEVLNGTKACQKCGAKITKDMTFCPDCGSKVN